jgi:Xaa-Pro aminopeptidase
MIGQRQLISPLLAQILVVMSATYSTTAPPQCYRKRRARLAAGLRRPLALFAGRAPAPNCAANPAPFRAESNYLYFGGPPVEGAVLVIEPGSDGDAGCRWFRDPAGPDDAVWMGPPADDGAMLAAAGLGTRGLADSSTLAAALAGQGAAAIVPLCARTREQSRTLGLAAPAEDELRQVIDLRLIKDEHELKAMRAAARVTCEAHRAAMGATRPGLLEAEPAAAFHAVLARRQCRPSFQPIITVRGEVLHGHGHGNVMSAGSLLLVDAAAEEPGGYAGDVTRTFPVNGRWSAMQRQLHDTVLQAMDQAIAACRPGTRYRDVHDLAARVIAEGLVGAGLLRGDPAALAARGAHTLFFTHGVGHLIGLDVHDMEDFGDLAGYAPGRTRRPQFGSKFLRLDRDLQPDMVVTIEPGVYMVPAIWSNRELTGSFEDAVNRPAVEQLLSQNFGGIRIEQTIRVTADGPPEVLTAELPTTADDVAACVGV